MKLPRNRKRVEDYLHGFYTALRLDDPQAHAAEVRAFARGLPEPPEPPESRRRHRLLATYPDLWRAIDGAIRAAQHAHPGIVIPNRASVVKRVLGQVLALAARPGRPGETGRVLEAGPATSGHSSAGRPPERLLVSGGTE